jgi:hypothetical protein
MEYRNTYQARWLHHLALPLLAALTPWQLNGCAAPSSSGDADTTPPSIVGYLSPPHGAVEVVLNTSVTVSFSEPIDSATLTPETFALHTGTTRVAGTLIARGSSAQFSPSAMLLPNTTYTATVTTGIKDTSGNSLTVGQSWTFTTGTATGWVRRYSGTAKAIEKTLDGGYVVAGSASSDARVVSLDARGDIRWEKVYDTSNSEYANAIQQTQDGGYIVAGSLFDATLGSFSAWVLKLDSDGDIVWQKAYDGTTSGCSNANDHEARSVQQTVEGGYIVTGYVENCGLPFVWILKLDDTGNVLWQKTYGRGEGRSIQQTVDGGYVVTGYAFSATTARDLWVLRLDSIGNIVWQKAYPGTYNGDPAAYEEGYAIQQTMDGGYVVSGYTRAVSGGSDAWVLRLDASGGVIWQKAYGDYGSGDEQAVSVRQAPDGGYVVAGNGYWLFRLDASGNVSWQKDYENGGATSLQLTADGGYVLAGNNGGASGVTTVIKLPPDGSSEAALGDTDVVPRTSNALATDTSAIPTDTNAVVTDTTAEARPR